MQNLLQEHPITPPSTIFLQLSLKNPAALQAREYIHTVLQLAQEAYDLVLAAKAINASLSTAKKHLFHAMNALKNPTALQDAPKTSQKNKPTYAQTLQKETV